MKAKRITSRSNPSFKFFLTLLGAKGLKRSGVAFLSGPKQVSEVLSHFPDRCAGIVLPGEHEIPGKEVPESLPRYRLSPELFREMDIFGTKRPLLLIRTEPFPVWNGKERPQGCTLFVPFQDPANVGAVIRSAAAFGVSCVVALKEAAHPFHPKSLRVAGTTIFRVPVQKGPSIDEISGSDLPLITLSAQGEPIDLFRFPPRFGLVPGLEGPGLPHGLRSRHSLAIPMAPGVESLNAALATGIALYAWKRGLSPGSQRDAGESRKTL